jgi:hypothetical protein
MTGQQQRMIENLELNKETVADLAELQVEQARGGRIGEEVPADPTTYSMHPHGGRISGVL